VPHVAAGDGVPGPARDVVEVGLGTGARAVVEELLPRVELRELD